MILKAFFCVQNFCNFGAILFIVNLLKKRIPLLFVFLVCLSMFVMRHFFKKLQIWKICYLVEYCVLSEIHASKGLFT